MIKWAPVTAIASNGRRAPHAMPTAEVTHIVVAVVRPRTRSLLTKREIRQKSAGLRTYTLVGLASALIILISKNGFTNILADGRVVLDPSRMAAQNQCEAEFSELKPTLADRFRKKHTLHGSARLHPMISSRRPPPPDFTIKASEHPAL